MEGWGADVIPRLAVDLKNELPGEKGFSERNIKRMVSFYREYPALGIVPPAVAQMHETNEALILQQLVAKFPGGVLGSP
ncbi:MAG: DUF1016 N-terminal domain-containing protein [Desulfobacterales bacterium]|nr:DUF1016 N-terminal domain-containing protein [Desulfobacterales bacterium]MDD4073366.1 DUF1016 N-terminal domain-containing protein [Desulfobacterales bacterium]MDD4393883.1 DUF1016 N-terminal domain-containing protein [Desulfobacterales bacterium]